MKKEKQNIKIQQGLIPELVSGIFNACRYVREQETTCVEDPRLQSSGMTTNLNNDPLTWHYVPSSPSRGEGKHRWFTSPLAFFSAQCHFLCPPCGGSTPQAGRGVIHTHHFLHNLGKYVGQALPDNGSNKGPLSPFKIFLN